MAYAPRPPTQVDAVRAAIDAEIRSLIEDGGGRTVFRYDSGLDIVVTVTGDERLVCGWVSMVIAVEAGSYDERT